MDWLLEPWPWYVSGPLIGLMVPALLILTGRALSVSSSFRHIGSMCTPNSRLPYIRNNDWRKNSWNLIFVAGIFVGGLIGSYLLSSTTPILLPTDYYLATGILTVVIGGVLVGGVITTNFILSLL